MTTARSRTAAQETPFYEANCHDTKRVERTTISNIGNECLENVSVLGERGEMSWIRFLEKRYGIHVGVKYMVIGEIERIALYRNFPREFKGCDRKRVVKMTATVGRDRN